MEEVIQLLKEQLELRDKIIGDYNKKIEEMQKQHNKLIVKIVAILVVFFTLSVLSYFWSDYTVTTNNVTTTTTGNNNTNENKIESE